MIPIVASALLSLRSLVRSRAALHLEILALRHQLLVLERSRRRPVRLSAADRLLWVWLSWIWTEWRRALVFVKPDTVVAWHRRGFRCFWTWKSRRPTGRPTVPADVRALIRTMSDCNPLWGACGYQKRDLVEFRVGDVCKTPASLLNATAAGSIF